MKDKSKLKGIGGWLILIAIGVTTSPFLAIAENYATYSIVFNAETWEYLTNEHSSGHIPYYSIAAITELIASTAMNIVMFYLIYLFYKIKSEFPVFYIGFIFAIFVLNLLSLYSTLLLYPDATIKELFDFETIKVLGRSVFAILIWVPYMARSVRVKNTFIN